MDEVYELVEAMFGGGGDELIYKMEPGQSDLASHDRKKRAFTAGLSAVGASAGAAGLALGGHNLARSYRVARYGVKGGKAARTAAGVVKPIASKGKAIKEAVGHEKLATGLIPLEVAGLGGEVMATRILHNDAKKKVSKGVLVRKDLGELPENSLPTSRRGMTIAAVTTGARAGGKGLEYTKKGAAKLPEKIATTKGKLTAIKAKVDKRDVEITWSGEIAKADSDKQQLFGWASVIEVNGEPIIDLQGDRISAEEMEKSAYEYVVKSRKGGDMHLRDEWQPVHKSDMIESFMVTPEKRDAMGLPSSVPTGWWVGFQVNDPEVWSKVKSGERTGFSIHGRGRRSPG